MLSVDEGAEKKRFSSWILKKKTSFLAQQLNLRFLNRRYMTVDFHHHILYYGHSPTSLRVSVPIPFCSLRDVCTNSDPRRRSVLDPLMKKISYTETEFPIILETDDKPMELFAETAEEKSKWLTALRLAVEGGRRDSAPSTFHALPNPSILDSHDPRETEPCILLDKGPEPCLLLDKVPEPCVENVEMCQEVGIVDAADLGFEDDKKEESDDDSSVGSICCDPLMGRSTAERLQHLDLSDSASSSDESVDFQSPEGVKSEVLSHASSPHSHVSSPKDAVKSPSGESIKSGPEAGTSEHNVAAWMKTLEHVDDAEESDFDLLASSPSHGSSPARQSFLSGEKTMDPKIVNSNLSPEGDSATNQDDKIAMVERADSAPNKDDQIATVERADSAISVEEINSAGGEEIEKETPPEERAANLVARVNSANLSKVWGAVSTETGEAATCIMEERMYSVESGEEVARTNSAESEGVEKANSADSMVSIEEVEKANSMSSGEQVEKADSATVLQEERDTNLSVSRANSSTHLSKVWGEVSTPKIESVDPLMCIMEGEIDSVISEEEVEKANAVERDGVEKADSVESEGVEKANAVESEGLEKETALESEGLEKDNYAASEGVEKANSVESIEEEKADSMISEEEVERANSLMEGLVVITESDDASSEKECEIKNAEFRHSTGVAESTLDSENNLTRQEDAHNKKMETGLESSRQLEIADYARRLGSTQDALCSTGNAGSMAEQEDSSDGYLSLDEHSSETSDSEAEVVRIVCDLSGNAPNTTSGQGIEGVELDAADNREALSVSDKAEREVLSASDGEETSEAGNEKDETLDIDIGADNHDLPIATDDGLHRGSKIPLTDEFDGELEPTLVPDASDENIPSNVIRSATNENIQDGNSAIKSFASRALAASTEWESNGGFYTDDIGRYSNIDLSSDINVADVKAAMSCDSYGDVDELKADVNVSSVAHPHDAEPLHDIFVDASDEQKSDMSSEKSSMDGVALQVDSVPEIGDLKVALSSASSVTDDSDAGSLPAVDERGHGDSGSECDACSLPEADVAPQPDSEDNQKLSVRIGTLDETGKNAEEKRGQLYDNMLRSMCRMPPLEAEKLDAIEVETPEMTMAGETLEAVIPDKFNETLELSEAPSNVDETLELFATPGKFDDTMEFEASEPETRDVFDETIIVDYQPDAGWRSPSDQDSREIPQDAADSVSGADADSPGMHSISMEETDIIGDARPTLSDWYAEGVDKRSIVHPANAIRMATKSEWQDPKLRPGDLNRLPTLSAWWNDDVEVADPSEHESGSYLPHPPLPNERKPLNVSSS